MLLAFCNCSPDENSPLTFSTTFTENTVNEHLFLKLIALHHHGADLVANVFTFDEHLGCLRGCVYMQWIANPR